MTPPSLVTRQGPADDTVRGALRPCYDQLRNGSGRQLRGRKVHACIAH